MISSIFGAPKGLEERHESLHILGRAEERLLVADGQLERFRDP